MNKISNQTGETIVCLGEENSHIRNKEVYNITLPKLIKLIDNNWMQDGIYRHTHHSYLEYIMEGDNIPKDKYSSLVESAYFYSIIKHTI